MLVSERSHTLGAYIRLSRLSMLVAVQGTISLAEEQGAYAWGVVARGVFTAGRKVYSSARSGSS